MNVVKLNDLVRLTYPGTRSGYIHDVFPEELLNSRFLCTTACCLEFKDRASEQLGGTQTPGNKIKAGSIIKTGKHIKVVNCLIQIF